MLPNFNFVLSFSMWCCTSILILIIPMAVASDADPLQDFCVGDVGSGIHVNGLVCKNPMHVSASDFASPLLKNPGNVGNKLGSAVTLADAITFPALNTQGLSVARIDFAPYGINPPHIHPRASEVLFLVQGTLYVGFVSTSNNTLFAQALHPGELFVFPRGLIHFQLNPSNSPAFAISSLNSQNPGVSQVAKALFASQPPISDQLLTTTFNIQQLDVQRLRASIAQTL